MQPVTCTMFLHPTIAFLSAAIVAYNSIYSSERFHNYFFLLYRHWSVLVYVTIYGLLGSLMYVMLEPNALTFEGNNLAISPQPLIAITTGIATKGIANIILFKIRTGGESVPIGLHTFTRAIDNFFENIFDTICYDRMAGFCDQEVQRFKPLAVRKLKIQIVQELAAHPAKEKVAAFVQSISNAATKKEILNNLLCIFGKATYRRICCRIKA